MLIAIDLVATLRKLRAPGMAWRRLPVFSWAAAIGSWLMIVCGSVMLAAITMLLIDRNFDGIFFADGSGGAPLLWEHLSWIFFTGAYMLILIFALARDRRNRPGDGAQAAVQPRRRRSARWSRSRCSARSPGCRTC